jgi:hypothetical protein
MRASRNSRLKKTVAASDISHFSRFIWHEKHPSRGRGTGVACERRLKDQATFARQQQRSGQSIRASRPIAAT